MAWVSSDRPDQPVHPDQPDKPDQPADHLEQPDQMKHPDQFDHPDQANQLDHPDQPDFTFFRYDQFDFLIDIVPREDIKPAAPSAVPSTPRKHQEPTDQQVTYYMPVSKNGLFFDLLIKRL